MSLRHALRTEVQAALLTLASACLKRFEAENAQMQRTIARQTIKINAIEQLNAKNS